MFLEELSPFVRELTRQPVAFLGGFVSGILRLNLNDDPVRIWLAQQQGQPPHSNGNDLNSSSSDQGPQKISID